VARFDVVQDIDDPTRFVLIEVYHGPAGAAAHKDTAHYRRWRDEVAAMMAEPRTSKKYINVGEDDTWVSFEFAPPHGCCLVPASWRRCRGPACSGCTPRSGRDQSARRGV